MYEWFAAGHLLFSSHTVVVVMEASIHILLCRPTQMWSSTHSWRWLPDLASFQTSLFQTGWFISVSSLENTMNMFIPVEISQLEIKIPGNTPACRRRHDAFNAWCIPARRCWRRRRLHHPWSQYYHFLLYYSVTTLCKHWASLTSLEVLGDTVVSHGFVHGLLCLYWDNKSSNL